MKHKKIFYKIIITLMIFLIVALSAFIAHKHKSYQQYGALLGCPTEEIHFNSEYNETFVYEYMSASYLQKMIEMDASKKVEDKIVKLSSVIKSTTFIIINIGSYDLTSLIHVNEYKNTLNYDLEVLYRQVDILTSMMSTIIYQVLSINNHTKLYLMSQIYPYEIYDENIDQVYTSLNESYQILANQYQIAFIQL